MSPDPRAMSKALLGSSYRAEIAAEIGRRDGPFSAQAIFEETGIWYARVQQELKHLLAVGMLVEKESAGRAVLYERAASDYWELCSKLISEWSGSKASANKAGRTGAARTRARTK